MSICNICKKEVPQSQPVVVTPFHCSCGALNFPLTACNGFVFLWPDPSETHFGGLVLPPQAQEQKPFGTILSAGKGYWAKSKTSKKQCFFSVELKAGDRVFYDVDVPWKMLVKDSKGIDHMVILMGDRDVTARIEVEDPVARTV